MTGFILVLIHLLFFAIILGIVWYITMAILAELPQPIQKIGRLIFYLLVLFFLLLFVSGEFGAWGDWGYEHHHL